MPIAPTDILYRLSILTGAAGNTLPQPSPNASLGKYVAQTAIVDATLDNLFDTITGPENAALEAEYRCLFVLNNHATLPWQSVVVWLKSEIPGGAVAAISVDTTGITPKGQAGAQAKQIVSEDVAPVGQAFSSPVTKGTGLSVGTIPAGSVAAVWVRRTTTDSGPMALDGVTLRFEGDTGP